MVVLLLSRLKKVGLNLLVLANPQVQPSIIEKFLFLTSIVRAACSNSVACYEVLKFFSEKPLDRTV